MMPAPNSRPARLSRLSGVFADVGSEVDVEQVVQDRPRSMRIDAAHEFDPGSKRPSTCASAHHLAVVGCGRTGRHSRQCQIVRAFGAGDRAFDFFTGGVELAVASPRASAMYTPRGVHRRGQREIEVRGRRSPGSFSHAARQDRHSR
jgi:hypothetical protein